MKPAALPVLLGLARLSAARTDLGGCVSSLTMNQYHEASLLWYVPDNGEICSIPDCGGGRAPPKNMPGCGGYTGTATLTPDYLPGWGPNGKTTTTAETAASTSTSTTAHSTADAESASSSSDSRSSMVTAAPSYSPAVSMATVTSSGSVASGSAAQGSASASASGSAASGSAASASSASASSVSGSSTSAAPSSSSTDNAAGHSASNIARVLAAVAAVFGAVAL